MILEAFAPILKAHWQPNHQSAIHILQAWLLRALLNPLPPRQAAVIETPADWVPYVLQAEIELTASSPILLFQGKTPSGDVLLKSLYEYCLAYEDWQYRRWLHGVQPADFSARTFEQG
jgi:hypothetical protein